MPLNIKDGILSLFCQSENGEMGWILLLMFFCYCCLVFAYLTNVFPVPRTVPGTSKQVGSQIFLNED